jgi:hypothetical protein
MRSGAVYVFAVWLNCVGNLSRRMIDPKRGLPFQLNRRGFILYPDIVTTLFGKANSNGNTIGTWIALYDQTFLLTLENLLYVISKPSTAN